MAEASGCAMRLPFSEETFIHLIFSNSSSDLENLLEMYSEWEGADPDVCLLIVRPILTLVILNTRCVFHGASKGGL
jgi:hypothetical protein